MTRPPVTTDDLPRSCDVAVVGAGHNGLVAAALLAGAGLRVVVVERADTVGGACRTEHPFPRVPGLAASTGAYLLGLMPPELLARLDLDLPLVRRDPHYFLPTTDGRHLLLGADAAANRTQLETVFGAADARADEALGAELAALREDLAPSWLAAPLTVEDTAERYVRPALRQAYTDLVRGSAVDYLRRFGFASELLLAMYAVTDGMPGSALPPTGPGTGANLLAHSMCRLPGAGGTWMVVRGGMGTVTARLAEVAQAAGAVLATGTAAEAVTYAGGAVSGLELAGGRPLAASVVVAATDPWRLRALAGDPLSALDDRLSAWAALPGTTLKVNLALSGLPTFAALPDARGQHGTTVHLLPAPDASGSVLGAVDAAYADVRAGRLPAEPALEWYLHSTLDPGLRDGHGHHSCALFVQGVPHEVDGSSWDAELDGYVAHLLGLVDRYAPGTSSLVADVAALPPPGIASHFGITGGHIFHVDNSVATVDRMPYVTGVPGLYAGAAGCHPAGSVIGAAGHNAAQRVLADLGSPTAR